MPDDLFCDHLKRILVAVSQLPEVVEVLRTSPKMSQLKDVSGFHRLVAGGVMYQSSSNEAVYAWELYRRYLDRHLRPSL